MRKNPTLRIPNMMNEIIDILTKHGPLGRAHITRRLAQKRGVTRFCRCCTGLHTRYKQLVKESLEALQRLEQNGDIVFSMTAGGWKLS